MEKFNALAIGATTIVKDRRSFRCSGPQVNDRVGNHIITEHTKREKGGNSFLMTPDPIQTEDADVNEINALAIGAASFASTSKDTANSAGRKATPKALLPERTETRPLDYIFPSNFNPVFVGIIPPKNQR